MSALDATHDLPIVFRAPTRRWVLEALVAAFALAVFTLGLDYVLPGKGRFLGAALWLVLEVLHVRADLVPMARASVRLSRTGIVASSGTSHYEVYWPEIVAADFYSGDAGHSWLNIASRKGSFSIPLRYLDAKAVWRHIRARLGDDRAGAEAADRWLHAQPAYHEWTQANLELIQSITEPLRVRPRAAAKVLGWGGLVFFSTLLGFSLLAGLGLFGVLIWAPFTLLAAVMILPESFELDAERVTHVFPPFGRFQMRWDEIERVEYNQDMSWFVFYGAGKRLPMNGPTAWDIEGAAEAYALLQAQMQQHEIETRVNRKVMLVFFPRNTRVKQ